MRPTARAHLPQESREATRAHLRTADAAVGAAGRAQKPGAALRSAESDAGVVGVPGRAKRPGAAWARSTEGYPAGGAYPMVGECTAEGRRVVDAQAATSRPRAEAKAKRRQNQNGRSNGGTGRAEGRALARRLAILRAAARAFRARGFAASGMRDVAREADLSLGNLYYYFRSKQELLYFCQDYSLDRMLSAARQAASGYANPDQRIRTVIEAQLRLMLDELDGAAAHLEVDALPSTLRARIVRKRDRYERAVRKMVAIGVQDGSFAPCDPTLVTRAILGALNWTARWYRPEGPKAPAEVATAFADYLVRGLLARGIEA